MIVLLLLLGVVGLLLLLLLFVADAELVALLAPLLFEFVVAVVFGDLAPAATLGEVSL